MPKRDYDWPTLLPEELSSIACQLSPSVQLTQKETCYPNRERRPAWWALILIDGEVEGTVVTPCPLESYAGASEVLAWMLAERGDHVADAGEMVGSREPVKVATDIGEPSLFGGGA